MKKSTLLLAGILSGGAFLSGCDGGVPVTPEDPQRVKIFFKFDHRDQVDTFNGTLTKDLAADGTCTVPFGFTNAEQDSLLLALADSRFFDLPDTLYPIPTIWIAPDPGPQILRVESGGGTKSLFWLYLLDAADPRSAAVQKLWSRLRQLVQSTEAYKKLPPAAGGYL